ncbi:MAG: CBASS cGAMP-activated phospholipase [Methylophilus sp.]|nr:CBASS cGAMP-activated phospholipase [Methylophilus sp.]
MQKNKRRILALDGGGIKGAFAAAFLETIEEATGKRIVEHFDLIAGTSTGGIIALGLGLGMTAREVSQFYVNDGPRIFDQHNSLDSNGLLSRLTGWLRDKKSNVKQLTAPKYDTAELRKSLERAYQSKRLGDSSIRLIIPAYHADNEDVYVFKTRHHPRLQLDWKESAVNVALATAAAPTYFQAHSMPSGAPLIDGGIWANNPAGLAAVEARSVLGWKDDNLYIIRLGCTEEALDIPIDEGYAGLLLKSTALFMQGQSRSADGTAMLLSDHRQESPRFFPFQPKVSVGKFKLDSIDMINRLRGLGAAHAREALPLFEKHFLYEKSEAFVPIADFSGQ